ncbi:MAG: formyl transferase [Nodosilinea sp. WJT8-NPBG4]|jgi:methionyl-tRNA formyltransferase|nr:formyl transferase [Nodosilinea sp. WJT8-NPBG4]
MQILYLGKGDPAVIDILSKYGDRVVVTDQKISGKCQEVVSSDLLVSYGYRHIFKKDILNQFHRRAINIHISLLPWNRGADPNLWSFLENTSKGVTIHFLDPGIDTGNILLQEEIYFSKDETLKTSYGKLSNLALDLLNRSWGKIRLGEIKDYEQSSRGSFHKLSDKIPYEYLLDKGWDTPIQNLVGKAL